MNRNQDTEEEAKARLEFEAQLLVQIQEWREKGLRAFCDDCARIAIQDEDPYQAPGFTTVVCGEFDYILSEVLQELCEEGLLRREPLGSADDDCRFMYHLSGSDFVA